MASFLGNVGAAYNVGQTSRMNDAKIQSEQLANAINQLSLKKYQIDKQASNIAGYYAASPMQPQSPVSALPSPAGAGGQGIPMPPPQGAGGPPPGPQAGPTNLPMPGATPMPPTPQVLASQLQPPGGGAPPVGAGPVKPPMPPQGAGPMQPPAGGAPPSAQQPPQNVPWWRAAAADMKKANPDASGEEIMAAIEKLSPNMTAQTKTDFENFKLHIEQQQKEAQLGERERNDEARAKIGQQNADTNASRAQSYDRSISERNQRALDNIGIKLQAAKAKLPDASKDPAYRALETQYKQVSQDMRAAQALGSQATPQQVLEMQDKLNGLSVKMDAYVDRKGGAPASSPAMSGDDASQATPAATDIEYLKANPGVAAQFDARFGQGASQQYLVK